MGSVVHVYGRGGDIVTSMFAANLVKDAIGDSPRLCVHPTYVPLVNELISSGMPVSGVLEMPFPPLFVDDNIFGSSIYPLSEDFFKNYFGELDRHFNCCLGNIPNGSHIGGVMRYATKLCGTPSLSNISYPLVPRSDNVARKVIYHIGSSSERGISIPECPFPNFESVFVGGEDDPVESWCDRDLRGASMSKLFDEVTNASMCVGSDSMVTHISAALSVPTVAVHISEKTVTTSSRQVYGDHASSLVCEKGKVGNIQVIRTILSRFYNEF